MNNAVVDVSKKKKNRKSSDIDMAVNASYSVIAPQHIRTSLPDHCTFNTSNTSTADRKEANNVKKVFRHKAMKFVFIIVHIAIVAVILVLVVVLFATLEGQIVSLRQQLTLNSQLQQQNSNTT